MQGLIHRKPVIAPALPDINQGVNHPLRQTQPGLAGDHRYQKAMNTGVGAQPPVPGQGLIAPRTLLDRHTVALKSEVPQKMAHHQGQQQTGG